MNPKNPNHPLDVLQKEFLQVVGISLSELSVLLEVSEDAFKQEQFSIELVSKLSAFFEVSCEFWFNLQLAWNVANATVEKQRFKKSLKSFLTERKKKDFFQEQYALIENKPFWIGEGWWPIVKNLLNDFQVMMRKHPNALEITIDQVKEKFGTLRVYEHSWSNLSESQVKTIHQEIDKKIEEACFQASKTCAVTGGVGELRQINGSLWVVLCEEEYKKRCST